MMEANFASEGDSGLGLVEVWDENDCETLLGAVKPSRYRKRKIQRNRKVKDTSQKYVS